MKVPKAIVIGSGVAGMAIAIRLALKGFEVTVFEKNKVTIYITGQGKQIKNYYNGKFYPRKKYEF